MSTVIEPPVEHSREKPGGSRNCDHPLCRRLRRRHAVNRHAVHEHSAVVGNDISTLPDFPAEIRAPAGSLPGVSGFQLNFSSQDIKTPGDQPNVLVAMNPAALKVNLADLEEGGTLIINTDGFTKENLEVRELRDQPARGRLARRLSRAQAADHDAQHECAERQR